MFLRPHELVLEELARFIHVLETHGGHEQVLWQPHAERLQNAGIYRVLERSGDLAFLNWLVMFDSVKQNIAVGLAVLHMGYVHGDFKEWGFRCTQLWLE